LATSRRQVFSALVGAVLSSPTFALDKLEIHHNASVTLRHGITQIVDTLRVSGSAKTVSLTLPPDATNMSSLAAAGVRIMPNRTIRLSNLPATVQVKYSLRRTTAGFQALSTRAWLPSHSQAMHTHQLRVSLPTGWRSVTQGNRTSQKRPLAERAEVVWSQTEPQAALQLIAGPYNYVSSTKNGITAEMFMVAPDAKLAEQYIRATHRYLALYSTLLGAYPHRRFSTVENEAPTGLGMSTFTLLGSRILRLPFIIRTSFPHEIVHSWWGNGVYVRPGTGNWSEGLTTYLADHWLRERTGAAVSFRLNALARLRPFVRSGRDTPLRSFTHRHSRRSQSVGYDKGMMLWHMLRRRVGDEQFRAGLRRLFAQKLFAHADYSTIALAFNRPDVNRFLTQWLERTGAPELALHSANTDLPGQISATIEQLQASPVFDLDVPIQITHANGRSIRVVRRMTSRVMTIRIKSPSDATGIAIDPHFDVLRTLSDDEVPATIGKLLSEPEAQFMVATTQSDEMVKAFVRLARSWGGASARVRRFDPSTLTPSANADIPTWWLGGLENSRSAAALRALQAQGMGTSVGDGIALALPGTQARPHVWLTAKSVHQVASMARAIPHYGRRSFVVFEPGARAGRRKAGQWTTQPRSMRKLLNGVQSAAWEQMAPLPALSPR
jgi:aminopeptidase N